MPVILVTSKRHTHWDRKFHARPFSKSWGSCHTNANQTESGAGQSILHCWRKSTQPTSWSRERHKGMQTGTGQVLVGSSSGLNTASIPADRVQAKPGTWKGTQTDSSVSMRHSCQKTWENTVENGQQEKQSRRSSFLFKKQQTANQRLVRVGLHCEARCDYHPWRQCSLYGLNLQLDNGDGSRHPCPPLDCFKRWQSDHTCHHSHRFNELATKSEKWNGKPRLECVNGRHPRSKTNVRVLRWTCRSEGTRPSR